MTYLLPHELYHKTQWLIRDYPRLKTEYEAAIGKAAKLDGMPGGSEISDPTPRDVEVRLRYADDVKAVERGFEHIPEEYREGVFGAIAYRDRYPQTAALSTWRRWRQRAVYWTAWERGWI